MICGCVHLLFGFGPPVLTICGSVSCHHTNSFARYVTNCIGHGKTLTMQTSVAMCHAITPIHFRDTFMIVLCVGKRLTVEIGLAVCHAITPMNFGEKFPIVLSDGKTLIMHSSGSVSCHHTNSFRETYPIVFYDGNRITMQRSLAVCDAITAVNFSYTFQFCCVMATC